MAARQPVLGCIADDFTGAIDLANNLVRGGMRVVQTLAWPDSLSFSPDRTNEVRQQFT
jgi:uncharacterized protein YgbK (DUF1537 family)